MSGIAQKKADFAKLIAELEAGQKEMEAGPLSEARGKELEEKAKEAEALQDEIAKADRVAALVKNGKKVADPALPENGGRKSTDAQPPEVKAVAGYMTLGEYVTSDPAFQAATQKGFPKGTAVNVTVAAMIAQSKSAIVGPMGQPLVPLTHDERKQREEFLREQKAAPTIGTGIIEAERVGRIAQVTADDRFTLRDVMDVAPTSSDAIKYVREESFTNAAAVTAQGGTKPESTVEYSNQTADIDVIAHHMPVHNQQLADWPALRSLIDGRLRYGLRRAEEGYVMYDADDALLTVAGVTDIADLDRYSSSLNTLIDAVRMGVTEVRRAGYDPNALLIDPIDWEEIELEKGTDNRYVWAVIRDTLGARIWSLRVVETTAVEARAGDPTEARSLLVGDFRNGATLYDRMAATVMAGWINAQFITNMQTLLAEERVGLAVFAPAAFAKLETVAAVAST